MSKSTCSASFGSSEDKIWSLITGQSDHTWRTDLLRIEEGEKKYSVVEYYKNGDVVTAEVSMTIPHQRYFYFLFTLNIFQPVGGGIIIIGFS